MDQLLHELRIVTVPSIKESQLAVGIVWLDRLDTGELRRAMPDEFVGYGDPGCLLPFAQHELEAAVAGLRIQRARGCGEVGGGVVDGCVKDTNVWISSFFFTSEAKRAVVA